MRRVTLGALFTVSATLATPVESSLTGLALHFACRHDPVLQGRVVKLVKLINIIRGSMNHVDVDLHEPCIVEAAVARDRAGLRAAKDSVTV